MNGPLWKDLGALGQARKAGSAWLLRDEFTVDDAAPVTSPRTCDPGPGTLTITDSGANFSISGGALVQATGAANNNPRFAGAATTRASGVAAIMSILHQGGNLFGWSISSDGVSIATGRMYLLPAGNNIAIWDGSFNPQFTTAGVVTGTTYQLCIILRSAGMLYFVKGGSFTAWRTVWIRGDGTTATLYPAWSHWDNPGNRTIDFFRVRQLPAPFDTDYGLATQHVASPADATEYTGNADGFIDMTITAPGSLDGLATTRCGFYYRADADLTPAWHCYLDGAGAFRLDSIASDGTRTNRINVAGAIAGGQTRTIRSIHNGSLHDCYTLSGTTWTKRGSQINVSLNDTVTTIEPSIPAGWTAANLDDWPLTLTTAQAAELDRT